MMGVVANVGFDEFPKQGPWVGKRCLACFNYATKQTIGATVIRDDAEEPFVTILKLDDGRHILAAECQHTHPK